MRNIVLGLLFAMIWGVGAMAEVTTLALVWTAARKGHDTHKQPELARAVGGTEGEISIDLRGTGSVAETVYNCSRDHASVANASDRDLRKSHAS
jgi:hypothetical protein